MQTPLDADPPDVDPLPRMQNPLDADSHWVDPPWQTPLLGRPPPVDRRNDPRLWKHYLPAIAGGKYLFWVSHKGIIASIWTNLVQGTLN